MQYIRHNTVAYHSRIGVFVCTFHPVTELIGFHDVLNHCVKKKVCVPSHISSLFPDRSNHETQRMFLRRGRSGLLGHLTRAIRVLSKTIKP